MNGTVKDDILPWRAPQPLMLAPMQGLTNRALRTLITEIGRPDVLFTEFVRVRPGSRKPIADRDVREMAARHPVPLVVQLIGRDAEALAAAARKAQDLGVQHINLNLGCPFGRMTGRSAGGALLRHPAALPEILSRLRQTVHGSFSVKIRAGYDDPRQIFSLLPILETAGIDFLIIHPRTVRQRFDGRADHTITRELVAATHLPVIANGDIHTAEDGWRVLDQTGAAGLMLGRGAIADPLLFARIRKEAPPHPSPHERLVELQRYLGALLPRYQEIFCGEQQVLGKLKAVVSHINDPLLAHRHKPLRRAKSIAAFVQALASLTAP